MQGQLVGLYGNQLLLGIILGAAIPEKLGLSFAVPLTFLALLVNDFRKFINKYCNNYFRLSSHVRI